MRLALLYPLALLAACSGEKAADDELVTLDSDAPAASVRGGTAAPAATSASVTQAVTAEGPKLEPLVASAISAAGLDSGACRFSPAQGALPVLVASRAGGNTLVSVAGQERAVSAAGAVGPVGGSFAGQGIMLRVAARSGAGSAPTAGSTADMEVNDADGPAFTYRDGFWACN